MGGGAAGAGGGTSAVELVAMEAPGAPDRGAALDVLDQAERALPPTEPAPGAPAGAQWGAPELPGSVARREGFARGRRRPGARPEREGRTSRRGGHKPTKRELERELEAARASLAQLQTAADPVLAEHAAAQTAALATPIGMTVGMLFGMLAATRGPHWKLSDPEADQLGQAWAPVLAQYLPADGAGSPWFGALLVTGLVIGPRVVLDATSSPAPARELTAQEARAEAAADAARTEAARTEAAPPAAPAREAARPQPPVLARTLGPSDLRPGEVAA